MAPIALLSCYNGIVDFSKEDGPHRDWTSNLGVISTTLQPTELSGHPREWFCFQTENFNLFLVGKQFLKFLNPVLLAFKLVEIPSWFWY